MSTVIPILDGHNDTLLRLWKRGLGPDAFLHGVEGGHLDLPRAKAGGFAGGLFACFTPSPGDLEKQMVRTPDGYDIPFPPTPSRDEALATVLALAAGLARIERASNGAVRICRTVDDLRVSLAAGALAAVLHVEGAEAIDPDLDALEVLHAAGLRSLGPVWSRPNTFGCGVPFRFPSGPDIGPGLTDAGRALVRACNELGILIDLSHLNAQGFWDVARISERPLVATHSNAHALCPTSRNLTDEQLDAIRASGGLVGVNLAVSMLRPDGRNDADTPLEVVLRHVDHLVERLGVDGVALGSDFDGTRIPAAIGDAAGLVRLIEALRGAGWDETSLRKFSHENWLRLFEATWAES